ncbi:MAG: hypothetical protein GSR79_09570 [Desulfurococcales archaeon]|nr:hypothetical protein [Desulfurococcales archaeon]
MVKQFMNFILLKEPPWIDVSTLPTLLPDYEPIGIASRRAWIVLAGDEIAQTLCPPKKECISPEYSHWASRILRYVLRKFMIEGGRYRSPPSKEDAEDFMRGLIKDLSKEVSEPPLTDCGIIKSLGCFIPAASSIRNEGVGLKDVRGPLIVINTDLFEEVSYVRYVLRERNLFKECIRDFLASVIAHEVVHAFTDLAGVGSPRNAFMKASNKMFFKIIEESLATYYQLCLLKRMENRFFMSHLVNRMPLEYRAGVVWRLWSSVIDDPVGKVLLAWAGFTAPTYKTITPDYLHALIRALFGLSVIEREGRYDVNLNIEGWGG